MSRSIPPTTSRKSELKPKSKLLSARLPSGAQARTSRRSLEKTLESITDFARVYRIDPIEQILLVKEGLPASDVDSIAQRMDITKEKLLGTLGLPRATIDRKMRENKTLSRDESSRVLGMARLVGQVQTLVDASGTSASFDAAAWVAQWLERPLPALDGRRPAELMDTAEGQSLVSNLVARMQSGAYS